MYIPLGELEEEEKEMFVKGMDGAKCGLWVRLVCAFEFTRRHIAAEEGSDRRGAEVSGRAGKSRKSLRAHSRGPCVAWLSQCTLRQLTRLAATYQTFRS